MTFLLVSIGAVLLVAGLVCCVSPVVPGPPVSFLSLVLLSWAYDWKAFSAVFLVVIGAVAVLVSVFDFVLPVTVPKRYGASKAGVWGSVIGMVGGAILLPPWGFLAGVFVGAVLGELIFNKNRKIVLKAALGVFVGTVASILLKTGVSAAIGFFFVRALIRGPS
jgi:hypothetical protein